MKFNVVKKEPVSVNWQTLFIFLPIVDLWATYRIQKLRLYLLIFYLGFGLGGILLEIALYPDAYFSDEFMESDSFMTDEFSEIGLGLILASIALGIILIRKWSREWNEKLRG